MTIDDLREQKLILFEAISGSRAYGTNLPHSDTDLRGVFIMPQSQLYGLTQIEQVQNDSNDIVFYELRKFMEMLAQNNPNIMELLNIPADCVVYKNPIFNLILNQKQKFITTKCHATFGNYAVEQIKKARGLNKKIMQTFERERKTPFHFCFVVDKKGYGSQPLTDFLAQNEYLQEKCGLVKISNMRDIYAMFYDEHAQLNYKGVIHSDDSNALSLSAVPEGEKPVATLFYNKDAYSIYCKDYKQYWEWLERRNSNRFQETMLHGKGYDGKNLMHCHRLLDMCLEIAEGKGINVRRPNRNQLLKIRTGEYDYDQLIIEAEQKIARIEEAYQTSQLPTQIEKGFVNDLLLEMREKFYRS
jgi:hypothetical protein